MSNLKYKEDIPHNEWSFHENPAVKEFLEHVARILAEEYIQRMKGEKGEPICTVNDTSDSIKKYGYQYGKQKEMEEHMNRYGRSK